MASMDARGVTVPDALASDINCTAGRMPAQEDGLVEQDGTNMTPLALAGLILGGLAAAAGATTAGLVLTTSGPIADSGVQAATASATAAATATLATPPAATQTATPPTQVTPSTPTATATVPVDDQGWPIVSCPAGLVAQKSPTRKLTGCGPRDFRFTNDEQNPADGRSPDAVELQVEWLNLSQPWEYMSLQIVDRVGSRFTRLNWQEPCVRRTTTTLLGFPAEQCLITRDDLNGTALYPLDDWGVEVFAETTDYWIVADAAGPQTGPARQAAIQRAQDVFASVVANGLVRVK